MALSVLLAIFYFIGGSLTLPTSSTPSAQHNGWHNVIRNNITTLIQLFPYGNKNYYINFIYKATYLQAAQFCEDIGMQLVSVESQDENDRLYKYIRDANKGDNFWSSGTNLVDGKHWIWMPKGQITGYTNWAPSTPDNVNEHCIELIHKKNVGLIWNDRDCGIQQFFICEKEIARNYTLNNDEKSSHWDNIYEDPYISPSIPLFHYEDKSFFIGRYYKATYQEAIQLCNLMQMRLVAIKSKGENSRIHKYVRDTIAGGPFWSSGSRLIDGKTWVWMSTAQMVEYTNWLVNQPDSQVDHCIQLIDQKDNGLFWNDCNCLERHFYICERPNHVYPIIDVRGNKGDGLPNQDMGGLLRASKSSIPVIDIEGKTFHLGTSFKATYFQAMQFCYRHGMQLISIATANDNEILRKLLIHYIEEPNGFWTSGNKLNDKKTWIWASGEPMTYFNWKSGEASKLDSDKNCVELSNDENASWYDENCERSRYFICEKKDPGSYAALHPILNIYVNTNPANTSATVSDGTNYIIGTKNDSVNNVRSFRFPGSI